MLGLRVQLGHGPGQRCINPTRTESFTVVDSGGIHEIGLDFCGCETAQTRVKQLLRARLFPATVRDPRTAATFGVLEQFHLLSLESKVSAYEFYHALKRRSDNTGLCEPKVCSSESTRVRLIQLLFDVYRIVIKPSCE